MASPSTPNPTCPFGCPEAIIAKGKRILELEEQLRKARNMHFHMLEKYGRVKGEKITAEECKATCEAVLRDVLEENERMQREIEDKRRRPQYHEGTATGHAFGMRPTTVYPYPCTNRNLSQSEKVPEANIANQDLARRLMECLAEANGIAQELEKREKSTGAKMQSEEKKRGV